ncbi:MAG TPA: phosphotransferase [Roseiflexaceae bacterium]|nr:phosphotransferase [Roseiflexaceae bacterium]
MDEGRLPIPHDERHYWGSVRELPLERWQPALSELARRHGFRNDGWQRAVLGRNVVVTNGEVAVKLGPPMWHGEMAREALALAAIAGKLPLTTPSVVAAGRIDGWDYLIQTRIAGETLWSHWEMLPTQDRNMLAEQHGALMAALHALPATTMPAEVLFPWRDMLQAQRQTCRTTLQSAGVSPDLVAQAEGYLDAVLPLLLADDEVRVLHGDLSLFNLMIAPGSGTWRITGLVDWGDVKLGPRMHDWISPCVHMYKGDSAALEAWYRGYAMSAAERTPLRQHCAMARVILYYAEDMRHLLETVRGASECRTWPDVARCFWHLA